MEPYKVSSWVYIDTVSTSHTYKVKVRIDIPNTQFRQRLCLNIKAIMSYMVHTLAFDLGLKNMTRRFM
ncbi:hypothetical protein AM501_05280 [Aneurinibacillus migulanus]|nr:hypothetical protein TS64_04335 [Aneurinibacillus migulanus]KPD09249.1 hypothetical protein AM501_05280 [Aneurinibacillus migulanus]